MTFWETIFLSNTIKNYAVVAGIVLVCFILKRIFSRYIAGILFKGIQRIWKNLDKKSFIDLVVEPMEWFILISIAVFTIDKLNFPEAFNYTLYGHSTQQITERLGIGIIIVSFTLLLLRIIDFIAVVLEQKAAATKNKEDDQLVIFLRDFLKIIISIVFFLVLLKACFGQPIGTLLTSLSIVGAAIALAAKESLENLIASFIIFFDKPFITGDTVKVNTFTGTVEKIGLRSTRIRTIDKTLITVPNKQMVDSVVDNWSMRTNRRAEIKLELALHTPSIAIQNVLDTIKQYLQTHIENGVTSYDVYFAETNKTANIIIIEYFTTTISMDDFIQLKEKVNFYTKNLLDENNIRLSHDNAATTIVVPPHS